jgi:hypothetical protein
MKGIAFTSIYYRCVCPPGRFNDSQSAASSNTYSRVHFTQCTATTVIYGTTLRLGWYCHQSCCRVSSSPKGVMLTHGNLLHQTGHRLAPSRHYKEVEPIPGKTTISILSVWHITERTFELWLLSHGCSVAYSSICSFKNNLAKHNFSVWRLVTSLYQCTRHNSKEVLMTWLMPSIQIVNVGKKKHEHFNSTTQHWN